MIHSSCRIVGQLWQRQRSRVWTLQQAGTAGKTANTCWTSFWCTHWGSRSWAKWKTYQVNFILHKYLDYVAITTINNVRHIFDNKHDLGGGLEYIKRWNRSKTAELGMTTHSILNLDTLDNRRRDQRLKFICTELSEDLSQPSPLKLSSGPKKQTKDTLSLNTSPPCILKFFPTTNNTRCFIVPTAHTEQ